MKKRILIYDNKFNKHDPSTISVLDKALNKLEHRINMYVGRNIPLNQVFNDDVLIHDIIKAPTQDYYVFKTEVNNLQIRILYTVDAANHIIIVSHFLKKRMQRATCMNFREQQTTFYQNQHYFWPKR